MTEQPQGRDPLATRRLIALGIGLVLVAGGFILLETVSTTVGFLGGMTAVLIGAIMAAPAVDPIRAALGRKLSYGIAFVLIAIGVVVFGMAQNVLALRLVALLVGLAGALLLPPLFQRPEVAEDKTEDEA